MAGWASAAGSLRRARGSLLVALRTNPPQAVGCWGEARLRALRQGCPRVSTPLEPWGDRGRMGVGGHGEKLPGLFRSALGGESGRRGLEGRGRLVQVRGGRPRGKEWGASWLHSKHSNGDGDGGMSESGGDGETHTSESTHIAPKDRVSALMREDNDDDFFDDDSILSRGGVDERNEELFSTERPVNYAKQSWRKGYACPTCTLRTDTWIPMWRHLKKFQHVRRGSYVTKEQLRQLLEVKQVDEPLSDAVVDMLRDPISFQRLMNPKSFNTNRTPPQYWMYVCPVCEFASSTFPDLWKHIGNTGHVSRLTFRNRKQLEGLLRRPKPPGSLANAFRERAIWKEDGPPIPSAALHGPVLLKPQGDRILEHARKEEDEKDSREGDSGLLIERKSGKNEEWTPEQKRALKFAMIEYPETMHWGQRGNRQTMRWGDRMMLLAGRVRGKTKEQVRERLEELKSLGKHGIVNWRHEFVKHGSVGVRYECCLREDRKEKEACMISCCSGTGRWYAFEAGVWDWPEFREKVLIEYTVFKKWLRGPGKRKEKKVKTANPEPPQPGYVCPGCGELFDRWKRLHRHLKQQYMPHHEGGKRCVDRRSFEVWDEVRLRCWLVSTGVKDMYVLHNHIDTTGWDPQWRKDVRELAMRGRRYERREATGGYQMIA